MLCEAVNCILIFLDKETDAECLNDLLKIPQMSSL